MKKEIIYIDQGDERKIEEEEQENFVYNLLTEINLQENYPGFDETWFSEELSPVERKIKLKNILRELNIEIINIGRELEVYFENNLVAKWYAPKYRKMTDLKQANPEKRIYLEMQVSYESIFDEDDND